MSYIGNLPTTQAFTPAIDYFSGNGSTTAFTLSRPVASVAQVQAVISNVPQNPGDAFTVSGSTITFTSAPPSGTNNIYVYYTSPITQVIQPGQGTVSPSSLSTGGPSWDTSGNVTLTGNITLNNGAADGAQLTLASLGYSNWNIDNYSGYLRAYYNATEYLRISSAGNLQLPTAGTKILNSSGNPILQQTGSILQVVQGTSTTNVTNYTTSYVTTGLAATITPTSTSSRIWVKINGLFYFGTSNSNNMALKIDRNGTLVLEENYNAGASASIVFNNMSVLSYVDSPASTSALTYTLYFKNPSVAGTQYGPQINSVSGGITPTSMIQLMEIAG